MEARDARLRSALGDVVIVLRARASREELQRQIAPRWAEGVLKQASAESLDALGTLLRDVEPVAAGLIDRVEHASGYQLDRVLALLRSGVLVALADAAEVAASFGPPGTSIGTPTVEGEPPATGERPATATGQGTETDEETELSFYELTVIDEHDAPMGGVGVRVQTPGGNFELETDGGGKVRVDEVPSGFGHARIDVIQLRQKLAKAEKGPRRTKPLPDSPDTHVRTMRQLANSVVLPDAEPQTLMIVTRTDIIHVANGSRWGELNLDDDSGPWSLETGKKATLALHADARSLTARVLGALAEVPEVAPPPISPPPVDNTLFVAPNHYVVQPGDTLVAIAGRLLGDPARWTEIWALSKNDFPGRSPDVLFAGDVLTIPAGAIPEWVSLPHASPPQDVVLPPNVTPPSFVVAAVDGVHDDLLGESFDTAWQLLSSIAVDPPEPTPNVPPPFIEELAYRQSMVELALQGKIDPIVIDPHSPEPEPGAWP